MPRALVVATMPEEAARRKIDAQLSAVGGVIQKRAAAEVSAARGAAIRGFRPRAPAKRLCHQLALGTEPAAQVVTNTTAKMLARPTLNVRGGRNAVVRRCHPPSRAGQGARRAPATRAINRHAGETGRGIGYRAY